MSLITVHIKFGATETHTVEVETTATIGHFKELIAAKTNVPPNQQRVIFAGQILKDDKTVENCGIKDKFTVHLVKSTATTSQPPPQPKISSSPAPAPSNPTPTTPAAGFPPAGGFPFLSGGFGGLPSNFQSLQQQLLNDPNQLREIMNSPAFQSILNNPEILRSIIQSNPQMREIIDRNPEIGHVLNDPAVLRQMMEMSQNPQLYREALRNTDRAMSNIEAMPEGFNHLRRMNETIQEPLYQASANQNPFSALFGGGNQPANTTPVPESGPLPNPWDRNPNPSAAPNTPTSSNTPNTNPNPNSNAGFTFPANLFGNANAPSGSAPANPFGSFPGMNDPNMLNIMMSPPMQAMMQQMLSDPAFLQQMASSPLFQQMRDSNPHMRQFLENPELMRQMFSPEALQSISQIQTGFQNLASQGFFPMGQMGQMGQMGNPFAPQPSSIPQNTVAPEVRFQAQLEQLNAMGFTNTQTNINLLQQTNGDVNMVVERLLNNLR
jgi:ubiquilin